MSTDTVTVEALAKILYDSSADLALTRLGAHAMADAVLASGILLGTADDLRELKADAWDEAVKAMAWAMQNGPDEGALPYVANHNPYRDSSHAQDETGTTALAAVRHEHSERIVKAIDEQGTWIGPMTKREVIRIIAQVTAARDLSPAEDPRLYDSANDGALDAQMHEETPED